MKKNILLLLMALPLGLWGQDSAEAIVSRYLRMMNYEQLPSDSTLVLQTTISFHNSSDTYTLRRWYSTPAMMRVELWHGDSLQTGFCTNGGSRHREYSKHMEWWYDSEHSSFHKKIDVYDFRGGLYNWQLHGVKLAYKGTVELKGHRLQVVSAQQDGSYLRYYMFDEENGLLVMMQERENENDSEVMRMLIKVKPIDYEVIHEYLPVGESLIMSQVSYMRDGVLTTMTTTAKFIPRDDLIFNQD